MLDVINVIVNIMRIIVQVATFVLHLCDRKKKEPSAGTR